MATKNFNNNIFRYVDLGLPSGTLWATCNVGAKKPSDYDHYFQFGDIQGCTIDKVEIDKNFCWSDYKFVDGEKITKYTKLGSKLDVEDDAAHVNMGGDWHIPTPTQLKELINYTTSEWKKLMG